jgi:hypothetical protein
MELTKCENPVAAVLRSPPMLCTRCAAAVGCRMTHHKTKPTHAHVRTVLSCTAAASLEAQILYLASYLLSYYLSQNPTGVEDPSLL